MRKSLISRPALLVTVAALLLAVPKRASAYVDPGSGAMIWQIAVAALIGALFYVRRVAAWIQAHLGLHSARAMGFAFASCYGLAASPLIFALVNSRPLPRFNDIFLIGIVLTAYLFTWEGAAYLTVISLAVSAYVLPPYGTFRISQFQDWYRLISFACVAIFVICLITMAKARQQDSQPAAKVPEVPEHSLARD